MFEIFITLGGFKHMNTIALETLLSHPVGRTIAYALSDLTKGNYALVPDKKSGKTKVLKKTPSHGTDFYKYLCTSNLPFEGIRKSNLLPNYPVELNASPVGSDTQEYAKDALVFYV